MSIENLDDIAFDDDVDLQQDEGKTDDIPTDSTANSGSADTSDAAQSNTEDSDSDNADNAANADDDSVGSDAGQENLSGIERYLAQFDIEGGMIDFEDGTRRHFNDLDPDKQQEILQELHSTASADVEDQYGLSEDEIGLLNYLRSNNTTVDELVDQMAAQRLQTYLTTQQVQEMDISKLDDDAVYTAFLLRSNPEAKPEQLEADLETAKKMSNFESVVKNLRNTFESERQQILERQMTEAKQKTLQEIENQRKEVVAAVSKMNQLDGFSLNDGMKNDVLDLVLNVDDDGDSVFMTEVFSSPENLFRAAFWYKNGPEIMKAREEYWKKEKSAAYKRGIEEAKKGKKTFTNNDISNRNETRPHYNDPSDTISLDDLYI